MNISLITVCFNSAAHIADALRSIDRQTHPPMEHIIIDGASRDQTLEVVHAHPQPWRRVISEPDAGIYDAMNKGLALAAGEVIGFLNSDDSYASPHVLAKVAEAFSDPAIDACYGDLCYVKPHDLSAVVRYWRSSDFSPGLFLRGWCPPHPTFFVRRRVYQQFGVFDRQYTIAADVELMARFMEVHHIRTRYLPELMVKMRMGGMTNRSWSNVWLQNQEIWHAFKTHGLRPSLFVFTASKILSRGKQRLSRLA